MKQYYNLAPLKLHDDDMGSRVLDLTRLGNSPEKISRILLLTPKSIKRYLKRLERLKTKEEQWKTHREAKKKLNNERKVKMQEMIDAGHNMVDISKNMGLTRQRIQQLLKYYNIAYKHKTHLAERDKQTILSHYINGKSGAYIAKQLNIPVWAVLKLINSGFTEEQRKEAGVLRLNRSRDKRKELFMNMASMFKNGSTIESIALETGYSPISIHREISKYLTEEERLKSYHQHLVYRPPISETAYSDNEIMELYNSGMCGREIAKKLGCSMALVYQRLKRLKLMSDPNSEKQ